MPVFQDWHFVPHVPFNEVPKGFQRIISKKISRDLEVRYKNFEELLHHIHQFLQDPSDKEPALIPQERPDKIIKTTKKRWPVGVLSFHFLFSNNSIDKGFSGGYAENFRVVFKNRNILIGLIGGMVE